MGPPLATHFLDLCLVCGQQTRFSVMLQIPPQNLSPNRKVILFAIPTSSLLLVLKLFLVLELYTCTVQHFFAMLF